MLIKNKVKIIVHLCMLAGLINQTRARAGLQAADSHSTNAAECHYADCRHGECDGASETENQKLQFQV